MSSRVPAGYYETTMHFTLPGQSGDIVTSLGWQGHDADTPPVYEDRVSALNQLMGNISDDCVLTVVTFNLGSAAVDNPTHDTADGTAGLSTGAALPANVAVLVQKRCGLGGRRNRGRCYFPGLSFSALDGGGTIAGATLGGLQTNWDEMVGDFAGSGDLPVLFHNTAPFTPTPVVSLEVQPTVATQRTRLRD